MIRIYDFDDTIYRGDSTLDFHRFCLKKDIRLLKYFPFQFYHYILFRLKLEDSTKFKSHFFCFIKDIPELERVVSDFWKSYGGRLKTWYINQKHTSDIIITASPDFLVSPIAKSLGVSSVIATIMDRSTGEITGRNCHGLEKVKRFKKAFPNTIVSEVYSDHLSDTPLFDLGKNGFVVKGDRLYAIKDYVSFSPLKRWIINRPK